MRTQRAKDAAGAEQWGPLTCALLGVWLIASPAGLGYQHEPIAWNDYASGTLAVVLGVAAARARRPTATPWLLCFLGVWILHAPLVLWTQSAAAYLNSSAVGAALITFSVILPRGRWHTHTLRPDIPAGWTFNPSSWAQRTPIITLAWINFLLARYLAAYQLDHTPRAWDPLFGDGTERVLDSDVSEAFPVSDAGLGAAAYMIEALVGFMGAASRWRTAPWTVALFGILVIPVGVVSTVLMILQPVAVDAWCTICLITAALMIVMACLALPEVVAMLQLLARQRRAGRGLWRTFWLGAEDDDATTDPMPANAASPLPVLLRAMARGTTTPPTLIAAALIGVWFVAAPGTLGFENRGMDAHVIAGALVIVTSILAMSEVLRIARFVNIPVAAAITIAAWTIPTVPLAASLTTTAAALALIALSLPRGSIRQQYGSWNRLIR